MRRSVAACGAEGDSARRFSPECSDYNTNPSTASDRAVFDRECAFVGGYTYSVCGCLATKSCYSDPLFTEFSCRGTPPTTPPPATTPPESAPESNPAPACGNGRVQMELGEECEPPNSERCDSKCHLKSYCGDGTVDIGLGEECELPGTIHDGWECNEVCKIKKVERNPKCGDGTLNQSWEECEPAGTPSCDANCKNIRFCGDGTVDADLGEECERPGSLGCTKDCKKMRDSENPAPFCGDGILQTDRGEQCEKAGVGNCNRDCKIVQPSETPLVQQTMELLLEGSGMRCSMARQAIQENPSKAFCIFFLSLASGLGFWILRLRAKR